VLWLGREVLKDVWDEGADFAAVAEVFVAETLVHELLFGVNLHEQASGGDEDAEKAAEQAVFQSRTEERGQDSSVDGMADDAVRAEDDEGVVLFEGYGAAPVVAEDEASPDAEGYAADGQRQAEECDGDGYGKDGLIEPIRVAGRTEEQEGSDEENNSLLHAGRYGLPMHGSLGEGGGAQPDCAEKEPEERSAVGDEGDGQVSHSVSPWCRMRRFVYDASYTTVIRLGKI